MHDIHSIGKDKVAVYRMGYHENAYERTLRLKYRACQKRYLVTVLGLRLLTDERHAFENAFVEHHSLHANLTSKVHDLM